jgi:hypothetical protein
MLQGEKGEKGKTRDIQVGRVDAEHAAFIVG